MNPYKLIRSYLTEEEIKILKSLAKTKGMTFTGYRDQICREAIARELKKPQVNR